MEVRNNLAQEAIKFLEVAQKFEEQGQLEKAIENYQSAAEYLKRSGYMMHRVDDLYVRVEELKNFIKEKKKYQYMQSTAQLEKLQDQAFIILEGADKLEKQGFITDAIKQYQSAINLFTQAGWSETQLQNIQMKIAILNENLQRQEIVQKQKESIVEAQPQVIDAFGQKKDVLKAKKLKSYIERKKKEEEIQNKAFTLIDNAKFYEKNKKFDKAIRSYEEAINLLDNIGWQQQTNNLKILIDKLKRDKIEFEKFQAQPEITDSSLVIEPQEPSEKFETLKYQDQLDTEDQIQTEAFNLIDVAKKLEREKKYDIAIINYQKAIDLLKSINWDSYVQPVINFINDIKEKQKREEQIENLARKREIEAKSIQDTIFLKEREEIVQSVKDLQNQRTKFQKTRREELEQEEKFYTILDRADEILKGKDFDAALTEYKKALDFIMKMGPSWQPYIKTISSTISSVKKLKEAEIEKDLDQKKRFEAKKIQDIEFQKRISSELQKELKTLRKKEIDFQIRKDELEYREERKESAFKLLEKAQDFINQGDFDNAIMVYQNVGNIFAGIQWNDEIPLIENAIFELERRKKEESLKKYKDLQKNVEKSKLEKEFQEKITKQMQIERQRLRLKEVSLREREKELEYREKRKQEAFKILEEAQTYINQGDYEKSIEFYDTAANILAEIHWYEEVELIRKAIIEIENKRREEALKKQRDMYIQLEKEKKEKTFQQRIINNMKIQKEKLIQKQIELKEKEKEIEYRENRKEEAFHLIDIAQNYLSLGKFNEAIETYRSVADFFAQIQWIDEIPLIKQAIREIEIKRKEKELMKQRTIQQAIQKEAANRQFISQIKKQREIEKLKDSQRKELIEKQKSFSKNILKKQEEAFEIIEEVDNLLKQEEFESAEETYKKAINILTEIGWSGSYMKLLEGTIQTIRVKKREKERRKLEEIRLAKKLLEEEKVFERKVTEEILKEQERLKNKKIKLLEREEMLNQIELLKEDAFELMDKAEVLLNQGLYDQSIDLYFQAELILSEINYPTQVIKEMIQKIEEKKREADLSKQYEIEQMIKKQEEEKLFQTKIAEGINLETQKMKNKQITLMQQNELKNYMERRKQDAFELLDNADLFIKKSEYNKALEYYRSAELILNEIQFPTSSLKELILKIKDKKREQEFERQKKVELKIKKERESLKFQSKIAENLRKEKARLKAKEIKIAEWDELKTKLEHKREEAFKLLDDAETALKDINYDKSIALYRKAMMILNEIQFPTDSVNATILKIMNLKKQKALEEETKLKRELEKIEEQKKLAALFEERKKREQEAKIVKELALKQREKLVQEQMTHREVAYSLLEEAGIYLKKRIPDYDSAISLYFQARNLLAEKIGWEPEINNLNVLINDLQQEKKNLIEKQKLEKELYLKRQREYDLFQEEIKKRKDSFERKKREQERKLKELQRIKQQTAIIKEEGFSLIDKGKKYAAYHNFEYAYDAFKEAINKFTQIGWNEQTKYIQKEIENTKKLQEKVEKEELEVRKIYEELKQKKIVDEIKVKEKEEEIKKTITQVGSLTDEISNLISIKKKELELEEKRKRDRIKYEAKDFRKKMGDLINLKQEITNELAKSKKDKDKELEKERIKKDKERAEEIKEMLSDIAKKDKK